MLNRVAPFRRIRNAASAFLLAATVVAAGCVAVAPARAEIGSYLVFDLQSGVILDEHNATKPWFPASLTKLMTAYVTFRAVEDGRITMKSPVVMSENARREPPSKMGFPVGSVITIETALKILMVKSANDVAVALAESVSGSEADFIRAMNRESRRLGMTQSNWTNPHGLPDANHVSSARDMALLVSQIRKEFPEYDSLFQITALKLGPKTYKNHNHLVTRFPGTTGMKTGFICASGFNLAATAKRGGREIGAIVLGGYTSRERDEETAKYLEMGFRSRTGLFSGKRKDLNDLRKLPVTAGRPVDLRPIVCGRTRPKTAYSNRANVISFEEAEEEGLATAYAADSRNPFEKVMAGGREPVMLNDSGGQVISYLRTGLKVAPPTEIFMGGAEGPPVGVAPGSGEQPSVASAIIPVPKPRPLFTLVPNAERIDPAEVLALADSVRRSAGQKAAPVGAEADATAPMELATVGGDAPEDETETETASAATGLSLVPRPKPTQ
ncbi:D-alanyl-D-alanine carboxypeptidase family protein [Amorphus sp. 3PC139-8]|uniref:D-alanyl-D-alanine carboxypeptidase family protein n=1 Tax=Amorphus sp. 3PC139-8 TaxID=2735676 RepID=UPI00345C74F2